MPTSRATGVGHFIGITQHQGKKQRAYSEPAPADMYTLWRTHTTTSLLSRSTSPRPDGIKQAPSSPLRAAATDWRWGLAPRPVGHPSSCLCRACCQPQQQPLAPPQQQQQQQQQRQQQQQQQTPPQPPPAEEANNSDGDSSSADDGRPQYFIRNSDSSATSGDDSSDGLLPAPVINQTIPDKTAPRLPHSLTVRIDIVGGIACAIGV